MATPSLEELVKLLAAYQESHGSLDQVLSQVQQAAGGRPDRREGDDSSLSGRRARRSRPPSRLSPSPVRRSGGRSVPRCEGGSGEAGRFPARRLASRRRRRAGQVVVESGPQDGGDQDGGNPAGRSRSPRASLHDAAARMRAADPGWSRKFLCGAGAPWHIAERTANVRIRRLRVPAAGSGWQQLSFRI
ncbi:Hypothetical predicted protein [Pelobates cultripes]|uniref:Uncharacterized protein n=1 Tax=Pelobates cultripes TaxID=61616 RepID=A0AAD1R3D9_PELCU|nr:Hypothetical predicted protein [Pelobates cultripes]